MSKDKTPQKEVWSIGVVKFFDHKKGFGFIASNNCHIPRRDYVQDFHVNDSSFADDSAKRDRALVVFKGVSVASQVRCYNKGSESDRQLGVDYFFDHEKFYLKGATINIFHDLSISREEWLPVVIARIKTQKERTPESTLELIQHFVDKYKKDLPGGYRYIFTKDFESENLKPLWQQLFDELSQKEAFKLLKAFPRTAIYFPVETVVKWIDTIGVNGNLVLIHDLEYVASKLDESLKTKISDTIRQSVDDYIINLIRERSSSDFVSKCVENDSSTAALSNFDFDNAISIYKQYTDTDFSSEIAQAEVAIKTIIDQRILAIIESWGKGKSHSQVDNRGSSYDSSSKGTLQSLVEPYQKYTDTNFTDKIEKANHDRELLDFYNSLSDFETSPLRQLNGIKAKFQRLKNNGKVVAAFSESITNAYKNLKDKGRIKNNVVFLAGIKEIFPDHFAEYSAEAWQEIPGYLNNLLKEALLEKSISKFKDGFEQDFETLLSIYDDNRSNSLRPKIIDAILDSCNLSILTYAVNSKFEWITAAQAFAKSLEVINTKNNQDLINIVRHEDVSLSKKVKEHIVLRLLASFHGKPLNISYEDDETSYYTKENNENLLRAIRQFLPDSTSRIRQAWDSYINSLSSKDIIELYHRQIIEVLPSNVISTLIQDLSLEDTYRPLIQWYSAPSFKDQSVKGIFSDPKTDTITPISDYLKNLTLTQENIYKIVWLVELLNFNKPTDLDFWENKQWEAAFIAKLQKLRSELTDQKIAVILWGVHFHTGATKNNLSEIYSWLPPYLQIRILKRMMMGIDEGKMQHTAQSLYDFLRNGGNKLCLPVEIVFSYLTLRESTPEANYTHKHMLQLIDSREDHNEWIGIRQLVEECHGRVQYDWRADSVDDTSWREPFYNGIMDSKGEFISLYLPRKMINRNRVLQNYNNKYFDLIQRVIELNFAEVASQKAVSKDGITYKFPLLYIKEVIGVCREFNMLGGKLKVPLTINENSDDYFCEGRLSNELDRSHGLPFYWCANSPCFRRVIRFRTTEEWEKYTILDFMRIFKIPVDYTSKYKGTTKFGYYIIFNSYLKSFAKFYEHLKCRECGKLLHPKDISNFATMSVTEFSCQNPECMVKDNIVYLNNCFNRPKCTAVIDSRDSKKCPNGRYICPECGGCCSTENERKRLDNLRMTGGYISQNLQFFIEHQNGHWERNEFYCYKCGEKMVLQDGEKVCPKCGAGYGQSKGLTRRPENNSSELPF